MHLQGLSSETMSVKQFLAEGRQGEKIELTDEQVKLIIPHLGLDNDAIFCITMQDKKLAELIARDILEDPGAEVKDIYAHDAYSFSSKREGSLIDNELDIVIETSAGEIVDLELQCSADKRGPLEDRVLFYASNCILKWQIGKNNTKYKFNRTVVCFLCGYDWQENPEVHEVLHLTSDNTGKRATENFEIHLICYRKYGELFDSAIKSLCAMLAGSPDDSSFTEYTEEVISMVKNSKEMHYMTAKEVREMYKRDMQDSELRGEARGEIKGRVKLLESLRKELAKGVPLTEEVLRKYEEM